MKLIFLSFSNFLYFYIFIVPASVAAALLSQLWDSSGALQPARGEPNWTQEIEHLAWFLLRKSGTSSCVIWGEPRRDPSNTVATLPHPGQTQFVGPCGVWGDRYRDT